VRFSGATGALACRLGGQARRLSTHEGSFACWRRSRSAATATAAATPEALPFSLAATLRARLVVAAVRTRCGTLLRTGRRGRSRLLLLLLLRLRRLFAAATTAATTATSAATRGPLALRRLLLLLLLLRLLLLLLRIPRLSLPLWAAAAFLARGD